MQHFQHMWFVSGKAIISLVLLHYSMQSCLIHILSYFHSFLIIGVAEKLCNYLFSCNYIKIHRGQFWMPNVVIIKCSGNKKTYSNHIFDFIWIGVLLQTTTADVKTLAIWVYNINRIQSTYIFYCKCLKPVKCKQFYMFWKPRRLPGVSIQSIAESLLPLKPKQHPTVSID